MATATATKAERKARWLRRQLNGLSEKRNGGVRADARRVTSAGASRGPRRAERLSESAPAIRRHRRVLARDHVLFVAREMKAEGEVRDKDRGLVARNRVAAEVALDPGRHANTQSHPAVASEPMKRFSKNFVVLPCSR